MSYTITRTNGTVLGTIADGTYDNSHTSLTLVGRNYSNYGQIMTNNLVRLIENSSYSISPSYPLSGQLWWDSGNNYLKVYTGTAWKIVSSCTAQASAPSTTVAGDLWWDTTNQQLYVYNGTSPYDAAGWILVGPGYPVGHKTGAVVEAITDTLAVTHYVTSLYADETRVAIISKDTTFTPNPSLTGFATIQLGLNMASGDTVWGTANNASYLGAQPAANYLRTDVDGTTNGVLTINNAGGLVLGTSSNLQVTTSGANISFKNTKNNGDLNFYANVGGTNTLAFGIAGATGTASLLSATLSGSLTLASGASVTGALNVTGSGAFSSNLTGPTASLGDSSTKVATTEWVTNYSQIYKYKIYDGAAGTNHMWIDSTIPGANLVVGSRMIMQADATGVGLKSGATAVTQAQGSADTGNTWVATSAYVKTAQQWWGTGANASAKFVSTLSPTSGDGNNGDFWFQIAS
jgi:hypothetical protein